MYNGEAEFDKMIKDMEGEILALQTAHQRPLGALNFFSKQTSFTVNLDYSYGTYAKDFEVTVVVAQPTAKPPIVQTGWDTPAGFYIVDILDFSVSSDYTTWTYKLSLTSMNTSSATMKIGVKSSQPIESISWRYV